MVRLSFMEKWTPVREGSPPHNPVVNSLGYASKRRPTPALLIGMDDGHSLGVAMG